MSGDDDETASLATESRPRATGLGRAARVAPPVVDTEEEDEESTTGHVTATVTRGHASPTRRNLVVPALVGLFLLILAVIAWLFFSSRPEEGASPEGAQSPREVPAPPRASTGALPSEAPPPATGTGNPPSPPSTGTTTVTGVGTTGTEVGTPTTNGGTGVTVPPVENVPPNPLVTGSEDTPPPEPKKTRVRFSAPRGTALQVGGQTVLLNTSVSLDPGPIQPYVRCPGRGGWRGKQEYIVPDTTDEVILKVDCGARRRR